MLNSIQFKGDYATSEDLKHSKCVPLVNMCHCVCIGRQKPFLKEKISTPETPSKPILPNRLKSHFIQVSYLKEKEIFSEPKGITNITTTSYLL